MSSQKEIIALPNQHAEDQPEGDYIYPEVESPQADLTTQRLNDTGNAQRFTAMFGGDVHYSAELKRWLIWDGRRWRIDTTSGVQRLAKLAMLEFLWQGGDSGSKEMLKFAESSLNMSRLRHLLEAAQSEPGIPIEIQELDRRPLLLNVRNGTLNLATQELGLHRRENLLTRLVDVNYDPKAQCPRWIAFLSEILPPQLIPYLQKALGYCLGADVSEKACFIAYGEPDAGKTTMLSIVRELLAEYSALLQIRTLIGGANTSNAQSDLADLCNTRFVQTSECGHDEHLAQQALKAVVQGTGGRIKAIRKYANGIEFNETWKIWIDSNPLPKLPDPYDRATLIRFHLIHFTKSIPAERIDKTLRQKLQAEFPGILAWLVEGFRLYMTDGLKKPLSVAASVESWQQESDHIPQFVAQRCVLGSHFSIEPKPLFDAYKAWCDESLKKPMPAPMFSRGMQYHGFEKGRNKKHRFYSGIKLARP